MVIRMSSGGRKVAITREFERIAGIPRRKRDPERERLLAERVTELLKTPQGQMSLRTQQAVSLFELTTCGGVFGPLPCGSGKTITSLLAPTVLQRTKNIGFRPLLVVPAALKEKTERDRRLLSEHWQIAPFIRVESYEWLGRVQAEGFLEAFRPDLIIPDEAHRLKNPRAAVTRRFTRYLREHRVTMLAMSGTMTKRSLHDYAHILCWCLPANLVPVPLHYQDLEDWADALDERKDRNAERQPVDPGAFRELCDESEIKIWDLGDPQRAARMAYRRRLVETPGVVATEETAVDASLTIHGVRLPKNAVATEAAFKKLREEWETPDGWPLLDGLSVFRHARELALGFYYIRVDEQCLTLAKRAKKLVRENRADDIEQLTSKLFEKRIEQKAALAALQSARATPFDIYMASQSLFMSTGCFEEGEDAGCAADLEGRRDSASITTMPQEQFEGFFVSPAIVPSGLSATTFKVYNELCNILRGLFAPPQHWLNARRRWSKCVREILTRSKTYDSELQIRRACLNLDSAISAPFSASDEALGALRDWMQVCDSFSPVTVPVWLDDSALQFAASWAQDHKGIVWVEHVCFGERLEREFGVPYYARKGRDGRGQFIDDHPADRSLAASIASNSTGRNLQKWAENLIISCPANGLGLEQLLSRTHRDGQTADEVTVDVLMNCFEHFEAFEQARRDANYIQSSTGSPQKLMLSGIDVEWFRGFGPRWSK